LHSIFTCGVLEGEAHNTRALIFSVKGEDLLFLDYANTRLLAEHVDRYDALRLPPSPFRNVQVFAPPRPGDPAGTPNVVAPDKAVSPFYWTLHEFFSSAESISGTGTGRAPRGRFGGRSRGHVRGPAMPVLQVVPAVIGDLRDPPAASPDRPDKLPSPQRVHRRRQRVLRGSDRLRPGRDPLQQRPLPFVDPSTRHAEDPATRSLLCARHDTHRRDLGVPHRRAPQDFTQHGAAPPVAFPQVGGVCRIR
jgi:hypothetical protein